MRFTIWDYIIPGVIVPLVIATIAIILATALSRKLFAKRYRFAIAILPLLLWLVLVFVSLGVLAKGSVYPLSALIQNNAPAEIVTGQVTEVYNAPTPPIYYVQNSRSLQPAKIVVVEETPYYVIHTDVEPGEWVRLIWATDVRLVYFFEVFTQEEVEMGLPELKLPERNEPKPIPTNRVKLGRMITDASFCVSFCVVALQYPVGKKIGKILQEKDKLVYGKVVPNRFGPAWFCAVVLPLYGILFGLWLQGYKGVLSMALSSAVLFLLMILRKQTIILELQGTALLYKEGRIVRRIPVEDIVTVEWGQSSIPYNRKLVIILQNKSKIDLEQENYWGLEDLYRQIKTRDKSLS